MNGLYTIRYSIVPSWRIENDILPTADRIKRLDEDLGFFVKLEKSILKEGFRNPIVITATKKRISNRYGGSRLMIAHKHKLDIPCIIADFDYVFSEAIILDSVDKIRSYFQEQPNKIFLKPHGINMSGCEHVHLKEEL